MKPLLLLILVLLAALLFGRTKKCRPRPALAPLSRRELAGLWRQAGGGPFVGYLYFSPSGSVYFMASRIPASADMFTNKFKVAAYYSGHSFSRWEFQAGKDGSGALLLEVSGEAIGGRYRKVE